MVRSVAKSHHAISDDPESITIKKKKRGRLLVRSNKTMRSYRFSNEAIDEIETIILKVKKKYGFNLTITRILELLVMDAGKDIDKVVELLKEGNRQYVY